MNSASHSFSFEELEWVNGWLILENGECFEGKLLSGGNAAGYGEVVFTTGMTGYPESITDPSYTAQLLVFTYPLIGNYGVPPSEDWESSSIYLRAVITSHCCNARYHHRSSLSLPLWLKSKKIPLLTGIDTRALTKTLRTKGAMQGVITTTRTFQGTFSDTNLEHLVSYASKKEIREAGKGTKVVVAIDCGLKQNIARCLEQLPFTIRYVPYDYDFTQDPFDAVFISNGPGDPRQCPETISHLQTAMLRDKPIFGICLGAQLLALAAGASTYKLPFGHRGHNQPCLETATNRCFITSQNHGFAINEPSLPKQWQTTFRNLNDGSVEGIAHNTKPFFAVQFHPEASPGPTDTKWLFEKFCALI